ncbi:pilus assembly protein PilP [Curvibacter sp. CHRR-16]|uniref:pilus assembly protein PilP n=1 Tax=Curvibacter sp. CHRR-16 TaxID=2835872 RepID=UPI001BDA0934|nr:pilus assembly protein PilP [Curvibacter sp. CHRR-16]MBT0569453.1 pilus assembly protein PilP [Curvibacter sp. CHRR-16]
MTKTMINGFCLAILAVLLTGCGLTSNDDLRAWMEAERNQSHPAVQPIQEPKKFVAEPYVVENLPDPFNSEKLTVALKKASAQMESNAALVAPELNRRKEPLESYPLDTMVMVGSVNKAGKPIALINVEKNLYQVSVGNYLGQNYGKIIKISETQIRLREIVQDSTGEWIERVATLELQEKVK